MKRNPEMTNRTKKKLTDAFWQLYAKKDIGEIHVSEITDLAGYHRSTFYEYFTDIYALLDEETASFTSQIVSDKALAELNDNDEIFKAAADFYQSNGERVSLLIERGNMRFLNQVKDALYPSFISVNNLDDDTRTAVIYEFCFSGLVMCLDYWFPFLLL